MKQHKKYNSTNLKEKLSIGELAKLRGITTETLRHYDRIGLVKPAYIDKDTNYRYYSIYQYEIVGTIKELRQLGMSIDEIKQFLNNRNKKKSLELLKTKYEELIERLNELTELRDNICEKINHLELLENNSFNENEVIIKNIESRRIISLNRVISDELSLSYAVIELENILNEKAPIIASNRFGVIIEKEHLDIGNLIAPSVVFVFAREKTKVEEHLIREISGGLFACIRYYGDIWDREKSLRHLLEFIHENGYKIVGNPLQIVQIDITITNNINELLYEIQIPIKK